LASPEVTDRYDELILKYAELYHLDARLLKSIIAAESEFAFRVVSPRGAQGLMQVMPRTAAEFGIPPDRLYEPEFNIAAGAAYVAELFRIAWRRFKLKGVRYRDAPLWLKQRIIAAYNAGPRFLFRDGGWYRQTRDYVRKVLLFYDSAVTDFRRPASTLSVGPRLAASPSAGTLY
jgi:soluble lytic murein transglycosylase-like protein